jgi:hypothetical protein
MQKSNLIILSLLVILVVLVASIFIYQSFFEAHKSIKVPSITSNNTFATNSITTTNSVSTTNSISTSNTIKTNSTIPKNTTTIIIPTSAQNYIATFLAPNPVSHYFFYIPLSFNSLETLNQTCLGLEKAYYNQSNYATIDNLLNSNNTSIFYMQGIKIISNYGNKLNETIEQNNLAYYCVYNNQ